MIGMMQLVTVPIHFVAIANFQLLSLIELVWRI